MGPKPGQAKENEPKYLQSSGGTPTNNKRVRYWKIVAWSFSDAQAMIKKSNIILLDEATSSLDSETEKKIQEALKILTTNKTTIVIAHRLSTILSSDNIYVIDAGKVVDSGKHENLLNNSELYKSFYEKQIQK